jgi:hypothetical protein
MIRIVCCFSSVGIAAAGAGALLLTHYGLPTANPAPRPIPEVQPAAFSFGEIYPWVVAPAPATSTAGAVALSAAALTAAGGALQVAANGALQTVNQLGPLAFDLNSVRAFSASQPPPGSNTATANYTDMDQWATGVAGLASSTGALGFTENAAAWDPIIATHAGVLQTANQVGPFFFNLNVLKAIGFTQAPGGGLLPTGLNDNFSAVDIGRWSAGIPGIITNTGTTGFVTSDNFTGGPPNDYRIGGLHTTTQVGPMTFDFNFLPSISTSLGPPGISFSLAPDMTAGNTPFAPITPPTPGVVQPGGGLPVPAAVPAPAVSTLAVSDTAPATSVDGTETPKSETSRVSDSKPTVVIPGVNGAPLAKTPTGRSGVAGSNPFKPVTDGITNGVTNGIGAVTNGIGAFTTGVRAFTDGRSGTASGTGSTGADSGVGTGGSSGGAASGGSGSGEG